MKKIIAFSGSNSSQSIHQALVQYIAETLNAERIDASITIINILDYPLPIYCPDSEKNNGLPDAVIDLKEQLLDHDALIIACPEYNGSMPAVFKNTIDWLSVTVPPRNPFFGENAKPVFLLSASPGENGGATNLQHLATLMPFWGGDVKGNISIGNFHEHFSDHQLDETTQSKLLPAIREFIQEI